MAFIRILSVATVLATALASSGSAIPASPGSSAPLSIGTTGLGLHPECVRSNFGFGKMYDGCNTCRCYDNSPYTGCTAMWCRISEIPAATCVKGAPERIFDVPEVRLKCLCLTNGLRVCVPIDRDFLAPYGSELPPYGPGEGSQKFCQSVYGNGTYVDPVSGFKCACDAGGNVFCQVPTN
ncbi:hypothetical protein GQ42DRAFT_180705 [Ramicandelaber brevisporus]|nr:hypothetical protein GQ42DRAFT_180705 [Ramicandelaber brevisporus]